MGPWVLHAVHGDCWAISSGWFDIVAEMHKGWFTGLFLPPEAKASEDEVALAVKELKRGEFKANKNRGVQGRNSHDSGRKNGDTQRMAYK